MDRFRQKAATVVERCRELSRITDVPGETTRLFLSPATREAHALIRRWMESAGLSVRVDAIGNVRGLLQGSHAGSARVLIGSHIDTVPNAGAFDGPLGVILAIACVEELRASGAAPRFDVEIIAFSEEEGVRFGRPFLGSLALIGQLGHEQMQWTDRDGITVADALRQFGLRPEDLANAAADPATVAYLEFHIEQGPVLDAEHRAVGVVEAIAGQTRAALTFTGHANHAGTTPMGALRRDALAAAAEWIAEVERYGLATPGLVATVGKLDIPGSAGNVVPGAVHATLDVRHVDDRIRSTAVEHLLAFAQAAGAKRRVALNWSTTLDQAAVPMDPALTQVLAEAAAEATGAPARLMPSGAGHDAMIVAQRIPSAMLFLRSPGGLSHHPQESVQVEDVEVALRAGVAFLQRLKI